MGFQGFSRGFKGFQGVLRGFKGFQGVLGGFKGFQGVSRGFKVAPNATLPQIYELNQKHVIIYAGHLYKPF